VKRVADVSHTFERAAALRRGRKYVLRLYVAGATPQSTRALVNIKEICEEHLQGRYELEVVDVFVQPAEARAQDIIAVPTLLKKLPAPLRRLVGDLSNRERVLVGLNIKSKNS
jgi:circadian clock protein KaiB